MGIKRRIVLFQTFVQKFGCDSQYGKLQLSSLHCIEHLFFVVFQVNANGSVLRSEIVGSVKMKVYLTGMPELRLGLNDKVLFENTGSKHDFRRLAISNQI